MNAALIKSLTFGVVAFGIVSIAVAAPPPPPARTGTGRTEELNRRELALVSPQIIEPPEFARLGPPIYHPVPPGRPLGR